MVAPPEVILLPTASLTCTVITVVLTPFAVIELETAVIVVVAALGRDGTKLTVSVSVMAAAFSVPVIVAVPTEEEEVRVAVYVPLLLSVTEDSVPNVVDSVTVAPPVIRLFPLASLT